MKLGYCRAHNKDKFKLMSISPIEDVSVSSVMPSNLSLSRDLKVIKIFDFHISSYENSIHNTQQMHPKRLRSSPNGQH